MAEFKEGQGIKTHRDNDVTIKIADGQSGAAATDFLTIAQPGDTVTANTNDYGVPVLFEKENGEYCIPKTNNSCHLLTEVVEDGDEIHDENVFSAVTASGGTSDFDKVISSGDTVSKIDLYLASPGCFKYEVGLFDGVSTFTVYHRFITQPASPSFCCKGICIPPIVGDGTLALRVRATNNDDTDNDAFVSYCFREVA